MGVLYKSLLGFSADLLGARLLAENPNSKSTHHQSNMIIGVMNNKVYSMVPPSVKSNVRVVAETIFDQALSVFQNLD